MTGIQPIILRRRRLILFKLKQCGIIGSTSGCINGDGVDRVVEIVLNVKRRERERERERERDCQKASFGNTLYAMLR